MLLAIYLYIFFFIKKDTSAVRSIFLVEIHPCKTACDISTARVFLPHTLLPYIASLFLGENMCQVPGNWFNSELVCTRCQVLLCVGLLWKKHHIVHQPRTQSQGNERFFSRSPAKTTSCIYSVDEKRGSIFNFRNYFRCRFLFVFEPQTSRQAT